MDSLLAAAGIFPFFDVIDGFCGASFADVAAFAVFAGAGLAVLTGLATATGFLTGFDATVFFGCALAAFTGEGFFGAGALAAFTGLRAAGAFAVGFFTGAGFFFATGFLLVAADLCLVLAIFLTIVPRRSRVIA